MKGTRRYRYIAFHVEYKDTRCGVSTSQLIQDLRLQATTLFSKSLKDLGVWVIQFDGTDGIIKCHYREKEHLIQMLISLKSIGHSAVTITTSSTAGTIKASLKKKLKK